MNASQFLKRLAAGTLLLVGFMVAFAPEAHAQETVSPEQAAVNRLAAAMSTLYVNDQASIPSSNGDFTYTYDGASIACEKKGLGGNQTECVQGDLTATCTTATFIGGTSAGGVTTTQCEIKKDGQLQKVAGQDRFTPSSQFFGLDSQGETQTVNPDTGELTKTPTGNGDSCSAGNPVSCILSLPGMLFSALAYVFLLISSGLLWLAGTVFNWVVIRTVFQFGTYFGTSEGMLIAWGIMRDIANIGLLFGFIFMGVLLILNVDGGGHGHGHGGGMSAKQAIPRLILFAVLLNFSLFASQVIIDISNAFSAQFVSLAGMDCTVNTSSSGGTTTSVEDCANDGISGQILEIAGVNKIWGFDGVGLEQTLQSIGTQAYSFSVSLMLLSLFVLITAMVLLAGAIMLIVRVVVLSLLMVTSPIGFAGMVIPGLKDLANQWWSKLISQSFFAPVYLLLIFISIKLSENLLQGNATLASAIIADKGVSVSGNMQVAMVFAIVIGFMIASLIAASKMGAVGAKFATSTAANMTVGGAAWMGRRSIGVMSSRAAERIRKSSIGSTETGRLLAGVADYGAKANYDLRGTKAAGLIKGVEVGKPQKGGYDAIVHHATEEREKYGKSLKQTASDEAAEKKLKEEKKEITSKNQSDKKNWEAEEKVLKSQLSSQEAANSKAMAARSAERDIQLSKLKSAIASNNPIAIQREETALSVLSLAHERQAAAENEAADAIRASLQNGSAARDRAQKIFDARTKEIDLEIKGEVDDDGHILRTGVGGNAASYRYAQDIHKQRAINYISAGGRAGHHAAETIVKNANKSKLEKALDGIKEATEKTDKEKEHDHVEGDTDGGTKKAADGHGH